MGPHGLTQRTAARPPLCLGVSKAFSRQAGVVQANTSCRHSAPTHKRLDIRAWTWTCSSFPSAPALRPIPHRQAWPATLSSTKRVVNLDEMQASLQSKGVKYLVPSFVDMHGIPKAKMVPLDHLYSCSRGSELFTGAAVDGVPQAVSDDEVCAVADPATMAVQLPYQRDVCYMPVRGKSLRRRQRLPADFASRGFAPGRRASTTWASSSSRARATSTAASPRRPRSAGTCSSSASKPNSSSSRRDRNLRSVDPLAVLARPLTPPSFPRRPGLGRPRGDARPAPLLRP